MKAKKTYYGYIINNHFKEIKENIIKQIAKNKSDIFEIYIYIYDLIEKKYQKKEDIKFYTKIFESIKTNEEFLFPINIIKMEPEFLQKFYKNINKENLKIKEEKEIETISRMLATLTRRAIATKFKYKIKQEARNDYIKQLNYLKYGILKQKEREDKKC